MEDEIFGPILPILTYKDMDAAIREVEESIQNPSPVSFSAVTRRRSTTSSRACLRRVARSTKVNIHLFIESMPFGGVGFSGIGHYYG